MDPDPLLTPSCKLPDLQPRWGGFILLIFLFAIIGFTITTGVDYKTVRENWPQYRCKPQIMPFAGLYGADTGENFNYCMRNMFSGFGGEFVKPFYTMMGSFAGILSTLLNSINSLRVMMASMIGGITTIFSEFTERMSLFFFRIKTTAARMGMLMQRVMGTMFSILYMGMSGMTAVLNFGDTALFGFLDSFCFAPETLIELSDGRLVSIDSVQIGDALKGGHRVTGFFKFYADGQPMCVFNNSNQNPIIVSTNHYIMYQGAWIEAKDHPDAVIITPWSGGSSRPLICLNTDTHKIQIGHYLFSDYDETEEGDREAMEKAENLLNGKANDNYRCEDYSPSFSGSTLIKLRSGSVKLIKDIELGDILINGGKVVGLVKKEVEGHLCSGGDKVHPSTLIWSSGCWKRSGSCNADIITETDIYYNLFVSPNSVIETANGNCYRDYIEVMSPDMREPYSRALATLEP